MPAASYPGQGTTRRLMSRGRLGRAKAASEEIAVSSGGGAESGDPASTARGTVAPWRSRAPARRVRANQHPGAFGAGPGCKQQGQPEGKSHRMRLKRLPGRRAAAPRGSSGKRRPASPYRSAVLAQGENGAPSPKNPGGAQAYRTLRAGSGTRPEPRSRHRRRAAIPGAGTATLRVAACRVAHPHRTRGPEDPCSRGGSHLCDDPALSRGK